MIRTLHVTALSALCLCAVATAAKAQQPYAPKAEVPEEASNDPRLQLEIRSVLHAEVPYRRDVEAPPYPGAVIIRSVSASKMALSSGESYETLPVLVLASTDSPETVTEFYRNKLVGWSQAVIRGDQYFWLGEGEFDPYRPSGKTTPSLMVRMAGTVRLVPNAQTEVHVRYDPGIRLIMPGTVEVKPDTTATQP